MNRYEKEVNDRLEKKLNLATFICACLTWIAVINIFFSSNIPRIFLLIDSLAALIFTFFFILRNKLNVINKAIIMMLTAMIIGGLAFIDGGFETSGITIILIGNLVAVVFFNRKKAIIVEILSLLFFISVWIWSKLFEVPALYHIETGLWTSMLVVFALFLIILQIMVFAMKEYLMAIIIDLESSGKKTHQLAYYDNLTKLPNEELLKKQLNEFANNDFIAVLISITNLHLIRSIYGEGIGDKILVNVTTAVNSYFVESKIAARVGSEDFAVIIDSANEKDVLENLYKFNEFLYEQINIDGIKKNVEINISYARNEAIFADPNICFKDVKIAMNFAKKENYNNIIGYSNELEEILIREESLKMDIISAIENDSMYMSYQSKTNQHTKEVVGVEALARWESQTFGKVSPGEFIPLIEKINYSVRFGMYIVNKVINDYPNLCKKYHQDIQVSINISPSHFISKSFIPFIEKTIRENNINPNNLIFEITEEILISDIVLVNSVLKKLRDIGIHTSIDDFGSGYSSFNYLGQLELDELKIDKHLIDQIGSNDSIESILKSIISLAKDLDLKVIAEGVENKEQLDMLNRLNCSIIQGFYFSRPERLMM